MPRTSGDPRDIGLFIAVLCWFKNWSQAELSRRSGVDKGLISDYELGIKAPTRKTLERIAEAVGIGYSSLQALLPRGRALRLALEEAARHNPATAGEEIDLGAGLAGKLGASVAAALEPFVRELPHLDGEFVPRPEDRAWAEEMGSRLAPLAEKDQEIVVEVLLGDERSWALAELLSLASAAAAADRAAEALRLARIAVRLAEGAPGPESWRLRLRGWCEPFLANAARVGGDLQASAKTFARADQLWERGAAGDPAGLLDGTRRLDLKASLRLEQGRFSEALDLLERALAASPPREAARLLLKQARTHTTAGDYERSLEVLRQAEPRIDARREPRLLNILNFNRLVDLLHLDRYPNAERLLPQVEALTDPRKQLDTIRLRWLQGRTWAGLGRRPEALAALSEVRRYFQAEQIPYDFALVSLELAVLHLEQGEARPAQKLAAEMLWIFESQKVHQEALAALGLFCHAARAGELQVEGTRRLIKFLYRAQHNPRLRFEA